MFTLILDKIISSPRGVATSTVSVPGFSTEELAKRAGVDWCKVNSISATSCYYTVVQMSSNTGLGL